MKQSSAFYFLSNLLDIVHSLCHELILDFGVEIEKKATQVQEGEDNTKLFDKAFLVKAHRVALVGVKHAEKGTPKDHREALGYEEQVIELLREQLDLK